MPRENSVAQSDSAAVALVSAAAWPWLDGELAWRPWHDDTRELAQVEDRPLLFYVAAAGCEGLFAKPSALLRQMVEERYVGVRIDPFMRPDLVRYLHPGACPALVIALPDGRVFARATDIPPDHVELFLQRLLDAYKNERRSIEGKVRQQAARTAADKIGSDAISEEVYRRGLEAFDERHGGFYGPRKFGHARLMRFIWRYAELHGDARGRQVVLRSLEALLNSPLRDEQRGGYYLYSYTPDWSTPASEKDALDQAEMLHLLLETGREQAALELVQYLARELYEPKTGGFRSRQIKRTAESWWTEPRYYADRNAALLRALLAVAQRLDSAEAERLALAAGAFIEQNCIGERGMVQHGCATDGISGLLTDQALVALALAELATWSGDERFSRLARLVASYAEEQLYSEEHGAFFSGLDPMSRHIEFSDDARPAGNALMAEWYGVQGQYDRARRLLEAAHFSTLPAASSWARLLLEYKEAKHL